MKFLLRWLNRFYEGALVVWLAASAGLLAFMALSVSLDVAIRNFSQASFQLLGFSVSWNLGWKNLPWVLEVSEYILFGATFLAAPWVLRHGGHVRVDVVERALGPRARRALRLLAHSAGLAVCLFLVIYGARTALDAYRLNTLIFKHFVVPEWWLLPLIPIPSLLLTTEFLLRLTGLRGEAGPDGAQISPDGS